MTYNYVDTNLCNFTDDIMDIWAARRAEKQYFPDSALSGKINKDTLQKTTEVKPNVQNPNGEKSVATSDGKDDGKISFTEKMKNFGEGLVKPIKTIFSSPKNMVITAASIAGGAALIALTGGAAAPVMVAAGLAGGTVQVGKGIYRQLNAKTDNEARLAWQDMGSGTFTIGASAAGAKSSLKAAKVDGAKNMSTMKALGKCLVDLPKNIKTSINNISLKFSANSVTNVPGESTSSIPTPSQQPADVTPESTLTPNVSSKPTVDVVPEVNANPTVSSNEIVDVIPESKLNVAVPNSQPVKLIPERTSASTNKQLTLVENKVAPTFALKPKEILALPESSSVSSGKSSALVVLPENKPVLLNPSKKQTLLALPPHKGVKEKLSLFDRIKQLLNVFGLFLSKNN
ncbi:TPA: hypothetical protein IAA87_04400 [Candidatus Avigastranaerophilus faecigallinarum]|nr:hypothetical protein [Candidatus Avigastranaerophilus faecigallinarum]